MTISFNKRNNFNNPYQGGDKRVLCVCSAGLLRSPTAAFVLQKKYGFNTRAAGVDERYALVLASEELVSWSHEIVFMEESHKIDLLFMWPMWEAHIDRCSVVLNVPDEYARMDERLQQRILNAYKDTGYEE